MKRFIRWVMKIFKKKTDRGNWNLPPTANEATFGNIQIELHGMVNFSENEKEKFLKAVDIGNTVLNSVEFQEKLSEMVCAENKGMSGTQIWELICTGKDIYNPESDNDIDVFVTMYHNFWTGTIGYTFPNTWKTWMNRKFFSRFNEAEILGNVIHEAMHNFGFTHKVKSTKQQSVPYRVGYLARDLAKSIMEGKELTSRKVV